MIQHVHVRGSRGRRVNLVKYSQSSICFPRMISWRDTKGLVAVIKSCVGAMPIFSTRRARSSREIFTRGEGGQVISRPSQFEIHIRSGSPTGQIVASSILKKSTGALAFKLCMHLHGRSGHKVLARDHLSSDTVARTAKSPRREVVHGVRLSRSPRWPG